MDKAIELDETASALGFLALEWALTTSFLINSTGGVDVVGGPFVGVVDEDFPRK